MYSFELRKIAITKNFPRYMPDIKIQLNIFDHKQFPAAYSKESFLGHDFTLKLEIKFFLKFKKLKYYLSFQYKSMYDYSLLKRVRGSGIHWGWRTSLAQSSSYFFQIVAHCCLNNHRFLREGRPPMSTSPRPSLNIAVCALFLNESIQNRVWSRSV